jgi:protein SCO1/2
MSQRTTRLLLIFVAFAAGLASVLTVVLLVSNHVPGPTIASASAIGGPFTLTDQNGKSVTDAALKGHPSLVFFGYTHCPDYCPTTLFEVSEILRALGPDAGRARAFFVTVDPERDTPAILKDYLSNFDPRLEGLTGSQAAIDHMIKTYRVYAKNVPTGDGDYSMDHSILVYLMDKQGRFVAPFNLKRSPEAAAADLRRYL